MRILVVRAVASDTPDAEIEAEFEVFASPGTEVKAVHPARGPSSIESRFDIAVAAPQVVRLVHQGEKDGFDACIVNCFADPGVGAAREVVRIPVIGPGEASLTMASALGVRIGVVTVVRELKPFIIESLRAGGFSERVVSLRAVDIPVLELHEKDRLLRAFVKEAVAAVVNDGAHVIVAGCTGMVGLARQGYEALRAAGIDVPVVDPQGAAMTLAESLVRMSLRHSILSYSRPPHKAKNTDTTGHLAGGDRD